LIRVNPVKLPARFYARWDRLADPIPTGFLSCDADGNGSHAGPIHFATLAKNFAVGSADFVVIA